MKSEAERQIGSIKLWVRTLIVFAAGVAVSVIVSALLEYLLVVQHLLTSAPKGGSDLFRGLLATASLSGLLIGPAAAVAAGAFVGLFQRRHPAILAAFCLLPEFLDALISDHNKLWAHSLQGISQFVGLASLSFILAACAAALVSTRVRHRPPT